MCGNNQGAFANIVGEKSFRFQDHTVTDQSSIIHFIEDNWLGGMRIGQGSFDAIASSITPDVRLEPSPRGWKALARFFDRDPVRDWTNKAQEGNKIGHAKGLRMPVLRQILLPSDRRAVACELSLMPGQPVVLSGRTAQREEGYRAEGA